MGDGQQMTTALFFERKTNVLWAMDWYKRMCLKRHAVVRNIQLRCRTYGVFC